MTDIVLFNSNQAESAELAVTEQLELAQIEIDYLKESYGDAVRAMLAMDNIGWDLLKGKNSQSGFSLEQLKDIAEKLDEWTDSNPLLNRGNEQRCSYMFGNGYELGRKNGKISDRIQKLIDSDLNQDAVFGEEALNTNERLRYTQGAVFMLYKKAKNTFQRIQLAQIADFVTDPDNDEVVWFYKRSYDQELINLSTGERVVNSINIWYPTDRWDAAKDPRPTIIQGDKVDYNCVMIDDIVSRHGGNTLGVPDAFTAAPWALAYSAYLRDGTKVLASLAEWVWKLSPKSAGGAAAAGVQVKTKTGGAGGTVVSDMDVEALPRANAVDLNTGRPLAAMVASSIGLSIVVILSDPGQSGAYGTAATLTDPSLRTLQSRQSVNTRFLQRCLRQLGIPDATVRWPKMAPDADYREQQTLNGALGSGLFWADEIREPLAKVAGIELKHPKEPKGFMLPNNSDYPDTLTNDDQQATNDAKAAATAAAAAKAADGSTVNPDGSTSLTNGQGRANTAKPSYGVNDLRNTGGRNN